MISILEAFRIVINRMKEWVETNFLRKSNIDNAISTTSNNPVRNKIIALALNEQLEATKTYTDSGVSTHNTSSTAHNDIRSLIVGLTTRLNTLANSDDTTLDQMSEIVAYIKSNKSLIDSITTNKVNVSDIINNLTTNVTNKPLSAAQGMALKSAIDAIVVPTKVSQLTNDKNYISSYTETDPTVPAWAKASTKPKYTASEVGADATGTAESVVSAHNSATNNHTDIRNSIQSLQTSVNNISVPTKVSQLTNDKGYITGYTETDPTVPSWAKATTKPTYTKSEVGLSNVDNVKQYSTSNPPPYPVKSVNGQTGAVTISTLPAVTTSDNGKVLMVVNGVWSVVDLNLSVDSNGVVSV